MTTRNKTIRLGIEEEKEYLNRCLTLDTKVKEIADIYDHTICGDMKEVLPLLPEESIDLIIADPPYNLTKTYQNRTFSKQSEEEYEAYTREWVALVEPLLKENGSIYVCCDWESSLIIGRVLQEFLFVQNRITWQREKGRGAARNWKNGMEDIWFCTKSQDYIFHLDDVKQRRKVIAPYREDGKPKDWKEEGGQKYRDTCPSNFWDDITIPFWSMAENTPHPTQKPEKLLAKLILASSSEGDVVFDPFLGSGSTSVTAKKLSRHYLGVEREGEYCALAEKRLQMAEETPTIQGFSDGVFWERNSGKMK